MDGYVAAGYGTTLFALTAYGLWVIRRGKRLSRLHGENEGGTPK